MGHVLSRGSAGGGWLRCRYRKRCSYSSQPLDARAGSRSLRPDVSASTRGKRMTRYDWRSRLESFTLGVPLRNLERNERDPRRENVLICRSGPISFLRQGCFVTFEMETLAACLRDVVFLVCMRLPPIKSDQIRKVDGWGAATKDKAATAVRRHERARRDKRSAAQRGGVGLWG